MMKKCWPKKTYILWLFARVIWWQGFVDIGPKHFGHLISGESSPCSYIWHHLGLIWTGLRVGQLQGGIPSGNLIRFPKTNIPQHQHISSYNFHYIQSVVVLSKNPWDVHPTRHLHWRIFKQFFFSWEEWISRMDIWRTITSLHELLELLRAFHDDRTYVPQINMFSLQLIQGGAPVR